MNIKKIVIVAIMLIAGILVLVKSCFSKDINPIEEFNEPMPTHEETTIDDTPLDVNDDSGELYGIHMEEVNSILPILPDYYNDYPLEQITEEINSVLRGKYEGILLNERIREGIEAFNKQIGYNQVLHAEVYQDEPIITIQIEILDKNPEIEEMESTNIHKAIDILVMEYDPEDYTIKSFKRIR